MKKKIIKLMTIVLFLEFGVCSLSFLRANAYVLGANTRHTSISISDRFMAQAVSLSSTGVKARNNNENIATIFGTSNVNGGGKKRLYILFW
jgi:uncharacterized membrane protein SpoIIM required for sporulation